MKAVYIISFGFIFFLLSSTIYRYDICCMFSATRYYGWPNSFITLSKSTDLLIEAKKVESENLSYLLQNGWEARIGAEMTGKYGLTSSGTINLFLNILSSLAIGSLIVFVGREIKKLLIGAPKK